MRRPLVAVDARYGLRSPRRGVGEYVYQVYRHLADLPRSYDVVLYGDSSADSEVVNELRTAYSVCILPARPFAVWEQLAWPTALRQERRAVVHGTANIAPLSWPGPLVLTVHDVIEWHRGSDFPSTIPIRHHLSRMYRMNALKRLAARAQVVITVSEHAAKDISKTLGVAVERIRVTALASKSQGCPEYRKSDYFLALGAMDPRKNFEGMLNGFRAFCLPGIRLKVVGLEPKAIARAEGLVTRYGLEGRVDLQPMVSDTDLANLYRRASGFLYLSLYEGFGLPVLEAMALGCPVVSSDRASLPDLVAGAGLVVDPDNPLAVANAMQALCQDVALRNRLIQAGMENSSMYTWDKTASATHQILEKVVGGCL